MTISENILLKLATYQAIKKDSKGRLYYSVPTITRRNGRKLLTKDEIDWLKSKGFEYK